MGRRYLRATLRLREGVTRARPAGPGGSEQGRRLDLADVSCLKTLRAAGYLELDPVTFG